METTLNTYDQKEICFLNNLFITFKMKWLLTYSFSARNAVVVFLRNVFFRFLVEFNIILNKKIKVILIFVCVSLISLSYTYSTLFTR